jgi:ThiF family
MSGSRLVRNSADLQRLVSEGYTVRIVNGYLVIDDIPYVDATQTIEWGSFLCPLDLAGEQTTKPSNHVMAFVGSTPCSKDGGEISPGFASPGLTYNWAASPELTPSVGFSQKPRLEGYVDFYEKVTTYAAILIGSAQAIDPDVTPLQGKPFTTDESDGVFVYLDTFSSRAGITARSKRLELAKVVIVGLGGTGAYIFDLLAKTPICNIHLYDGDVFSTHNAFRAPGAATLDELNARMKKVDHYATRYSAMRRQIHPHPVNMTDANVAELLDADFVFLAMDSGPDKQVIISALVAAGIAFIDTGVGVGDDPNGIAGQVRVTTALPAANDHVVRGSLISIVAGDAAEYDTNLQVAELNMAAAVMAVIRFKKWIGFYADSEGELHSSYRIDTNEILNKYERTAVLSDESSDGAA